MKKESMGKFGRLIGSIFAESEREKIWMAFIVALCATFAVYRIELAAMIYSYSAQVSSLQPNQVPLAGFLKTPARDFQIIALLGLCYFGIKRWLRWRLPRLVVMTAFIMAECGVAALVLSVVALIVRTHYQLLLQLDTGLTLTFVEMSPTMFETKSFVRLLTPQDIIFLVAPLGVFVLALANAPRLKRFYKPAGLCLIVLIFGAQLLPYRQKLSPEVAQNPVIYFFDDAMNDMLNARSRSDYFYANRTDLPRDAQTHSVRLIDEAFVTGDNRPPLLKREIALTADGKPWNVLIFVLESTGSDYIFDTSLGSQIPMPFLQRMTREGLYLANHHASANNSAQAAFSIFTGLYPCPTHGMFPMQKNVVIPTLNRYLDGNYKYFMVHPTEPAYWFPEFMFLNNGLREFDNMETLPPASRPALTDMARNEIDCMDFLQTRLDEVREPFLAVYWSFIPHYPYSDYGPEFRILPGNNKQQLYYNNLRALDTQLQRIYQHLVETGVADRTVFVFVGDHGEAFEQHPGVWAHGFGSYSEMYRVPMLFWQPKLIVPQVIKFPTSHVDIIPTLLDVLGVPYDGSKFQGESVLRGTPPRKYIFTMDAYADYVTAINQQLNKVSVCFNKDDVTAFNLAKDPGEKFPLNENRFQDQIDAVIKFRNYQSRMVDTYNQSILKGYQFPPKHYFQTSSLTQAH
jgi:phosphoglycerol transferase MdoB-like AlkP superfamily enzyme